MCKAIGSAEGIDIVDMLITKMRPCTAAAHECTYLGSTHEWTNVLLNAHGTIESLAQFAVKIAYRCICPY